MVDFHEKIQYEWDRSRNHPCWYSLPLGNRRNLAKHLPNTPESNRLLRRRRAAHVFNDEDTLFLVAQAIIVGGIHTGFARGYDRYGLMFTEPIGMRIDPDGSTLPLFYGEVKIDADDKYHPIPRTRPSEE